jgi:hypothetical protein
VLASALILGATLLLANAPAKADTFDFSFGPGVNGTFTTGAASPTDPGYDLITGLTFDLLSGTDFSGNPFSYTNLVASHFQPGAAFDPTTDAFVNHGNGSTVDDIGAFILPDFISIAPNYFSQRSPLLFIIMLGLSDPNGAVINAPLEITPAASATPLPAALPLFASGLGGLGLLGWRRKRKPRGSLLGTA